MERNRVTRMLGWMSVGLGLTGLVFARRLCRWLELGSSRAGQVRVLGAHELLVGVGLLYASSPKDGARAAKRPALPRVGDLEPPSPNAPAESWRGSGLAEDVGVAQAERPPEDEAAREQRMREAQEQLGLPDPDSRVAHI
jgi:hypothetical protein